MPKGYPKNGINKGWFKKGQISHNKGKKCPWSSGKNNIWFGKKRSGKLNPAWKGENASTWAKHIWVSSKKRKPKQCSLCGKKSKWIDWANKNHQYKRKLKDYIALCRSCHRKYDIKFNNYKVKGHSQKLITFNKRKLSLYEWSRIVNISSATLNGRLKMGWKIKDVLLKPLTFIKKRGKKKPKR